MAPTPSEDKPINRALEAGIRLSHPPPGEEVVITGLSGRFPDADDVYEFREKLLNKVDLVSDDDRRWKLDHPEIPQRTGKINHVSKFDAAFFGVHYKQAHTMDPMCRMLLERAYEAIVDAGYNPRDLRGTRCGVFIGSCFSESEKTWFYEKIQINGFGITGCSRAMLANRISYWLGVNGPSYTVDSACSSSLYALEHAYKAIRDGHCDTALVGGSNLCLHPYVSLQFSRLGVLSQDGKCKCFDNNANGYCRSEAVPMAFLQKTKDARRIYATVIHAKTNCDGYKEQGITYPSGRMQCQLLKEFYEECGINPATLGFIEAHGTGTRVGDPEECNSLDKIFCTGRKDPLWIGSVKSNIGHSEPASGLCSVTKVVIAMETGFIPPNLHFETPREGIPAFKEGRLKVVTEKQPWSGGLVGVNSFGFGGANCHVLLKWNEKTKVNGGAPKDSLPRLVVVSGRTEDAVKTMLDDLESRPIDVEFVKLLHDVHVEEIPGHIYRGFTVLTNTDRKIRDIQYYPGQKRKIWFVFSGMGSQWPGMGKSLMKISVFASAVEKCHKLLLPKGIDLIKIITDEDPKIFDNILHCFVGIAAIQIGLVDILKTIGIEPDNIIGHSVGELGCAYADGCFTAEQMILAAYYRGLASIETDFIKGSMAAVGVGYNAIKGSIPPEIEIACHNGPDSCTLSGPQDALKKFVAELTSQGIFAKEVPCSNIPYHSRYIAKAGPKLLHYLQQVIPHPVPRSSKWICSSIPESRWNTPLAKHSSPEYHTNNLLSPVLFEEASKNIMGNAITIEIAPHGLLQAILKRSLNKNTTNVALTQRGHADNAQVLLTGIGKLYEVGVQVQLQNLYPHVPYPVSRGTPMISPLIKWEHSEDWYVTSYRLQEKIKSGERTVTISLADEDMEYLAGHVIDGRNLFPATGYLALVWETFGMMKGELYTQLSIVFENVRFNRATTIPKEGTIDFIVMIQKGSGNFEVVEGGAPIVTGRAYLPENIAHEKATLPAVKKVEGEDMIEMAPRDIYKELRLRGYHYSGLFRGLLSMDALGLTGKISWANNYVAFMDNMLQTQIMQEDTRCLYVPTSIQKLVIDTKKQMELIHACDPEKEPSLAFEVHRDVRIIKAGGIEIRNLKASQIPRRKPLGDPVLEKYLFVPHILPAEKQELDLLETIRLCVHIALENVHGIKVKVTEVADTTVLPESSLIAPYIASILGDLPLIQAEVIALATPTNEKAKELGSGVIVEDRKLIPDQSNLICIGSNVLERTELLQQALGAIKADGFLLLREQPGVEVPVDAFNVWVDRTVDGERILFLRKKLPADAAAIKPEVVKISEKDGFNWLEPLKERVKSEEVKSIVLVAEKEKTNGILGLTNCLRKEPGGEKIRCVFVMDDKAPPFDLENPFYADQLSKDLAINVFSNGLWGSYRHQALPEPGKVQSQFVYLNPSVRGDLSSFKCYESPFSANAEMAKNSDVICVYYSSLNFRDVMLASGKLAADVVAKGRLDQEIVIGFEFAGRMANSGRRVMGMVTKGSLASYVPDKDYLVWDVPDELSLAEAATIPVVYGTVYTALITNGRLKKGESILIHSGTGGVGMAAINVALYYGCTVFTTVGTPEKREYIRKTYPQIPDSHIGNSRDTSFEEMIKFETNGDGVDMVLNSLAEEKLLASVRCLRHGGRFMEIGKYDLANNNPLGMEAFLKEISFHGVQLDAIFSASQERRKELTKIVQWAVESGAAKPLKRTIFDVSEVEKAFRYMTTGKHMGKVLLKMRDEEPDKVVIPKPKFFTADPRFFASQSKTYVVIGGLGGFGLELVDWMAIRGARKFVLTSRAGLRKGYQALRTRIWKSYGAKVVISTQDVTTEEGVVNLLKEAKALGPVAGIFNLAVVLRDALFENQTEEDYRISFGGKAVATKHLDKVSRQMCPELQYFVVFSSVSCGRGNAGQTNYGMANSIMERICEARVKDGLPGLAVQWGAIGDVGLVADMQEDHQELVIGGTLQQSISSCLQCLDVLLKQNHPVVASMVVAEKRAGGSGSGDIVETVVNIMGIRDLKTVSLHSSLAELGMDSMMAVEIKQTLEREFDVFLTAQDIRGLTFAKLAELGRKSEGEDGDLDKVLGGTDVTTRTGDKAQQGLNLIFRLVADELSASEPIIALESKFGDAAADIQNPTAANPIVFLIPGMEGMATVFSNFAKNIKLPTLCLQYPYNDTANSDITQIAKYMHGSVKLRLPESVPFILVGHSTGALVALELAFLLESEGRVGSLFLLDGSPDLLQTLCNASFGNLSEDEFDTALIMSLHNLFVPGTNETVRDAMSKLGNWDEKLEYLLAILPETVPHSKRHQKITAFDLRQRLKAIIKYRRNNCAKLVLKITLVRPTELAISELLPEDYNLSQYSEQSVKVHFVEGNHLTMLDNKKVAQIINNSLSQTEGNSMFKSSLISSEGPTSLHEKQKHRTH